MIKCDAIKISYRQNKEGFVVSFALHPNEVPPELASAPIGSQWQLRLVELDDDGNAPNAGEDKVSSASSVSHGDGPALVNKLVQRAGILCGDPLFQAFLVKHNMLDLHSDDRARDAAVAVRLICGVDSRKDILPRTAAAEKWEELYGNFVRWRDVPEFAS